MKVYLGTDHPVQSLLAREVFILASQGRLYGASAGLL